MKPEDLYWCALCKEVHHRPNKTLHRGVCNVHDAFMLPLSLALQRSADRDRFGEALESIRDGDWNIVGARQVASVALSPTIALASKDSPE